MVRQNVWRIAARLKMLTYLRVCSVKLEELCWINGKKSPGTVFASKFLPIGS